MLFVCNLQFSEYHVKSVCMYKCMSQYIGFNLIN